MIYLDADLERTIAEGAGNGQLAHNSLGDHHATGLLDAFHLVRTVWFVVLKNRIRGNDEQKLRLVPCSLGIENVEIERSALQKYIPGIEESP